MTFAPRPVATTDRPAVALYSDTLTLPSEAMKRAMFDAALGDEQAGLDPTVNELCRRVAALFGKEDAVFLPSGTMCNQIAMLVHCRPGDLVLAHEDAHVLAHEAAAGSALGGVLIGGLRGARGQFDSATLTGAIRARSRYAPIPRLLVIEQTSHLGGGSVWPLERLRDVAACARSNDMALHMDGARLMNGVISSGVSASDMARDFDSVWLCFSKGLGAPFGAVLAGSSEFIDVAWRWKQRLGGAMRQVGMYAAACIFALDHNVQRLVEDNANASRLAAGIADLPGLAVQQPDTNIVLFRTEGTGLTSAELRDRLAAEGVSVTAMDHFLGRAVTHMHVDRDGIDLAIGAFRKVLGAN
ncbi:threonine aldolase family protein [Chelatococcus asaccharovorans]|uniref:L-threonine aldolase n=1 Tax=Chelatococcus asaccharovorans TaxID=28210 RepID=A0A2V3U4M3_9HYPH|nr:threonine aldolase family protein [Chelatococcus asaccharovorans]MBS7703733.1 low specificity L-threonine aldolase [Chelatococcus asaccharovorans]PXW57891.1 L-threonine aldolase [Chelatococcus asaccharovorans]